MVFRPGSFPTWSVIADGSTETLQIPQTPQALGHPGSNRGLAEGEETGSHEKYSKSPVEGKKKMLILSSEVKSAHLRSN